MAKVSVFEPVGVAFEGDGLDVVDEAVDHRGGDDQIVPYADAGPLSAALLPNGTLKTYAGFPHGMLTTQAETIDADLLVFVQS